LDELKTECAGECNGYDAMERQSLARNIQSARGLAHSKTLRD